MKEIHLEQGDPDWLAWRSGRAFTDTFGVAHVALDGTRITATVGSICGGKSPFSTMHKTWQEMTGRRQREVGTFAMARGTALEPKARQEYMAIVGEEYEALCVESTATPWIAASLDGANIIRSRGVEIKCPISERIHDMAMLGQVPEYYYDQIQWQMLATDNQIQEIDFFSYAPQIGKAAPITVKLDVVRQGELLLEAMRLRVAIITDVELCGSEFEQAAKSYLVLNSRLKLLQTDVDTAKDRLKKLADGKSTQGSGVMVIVSSNDGRTSWEKVAIDLSKQLDMTQDALDQIALMHKSKPTTVTTVKEASDASAVLEELRSRQFAQGISMEIQAEKLEQPTPVW
ncbi:lambda-exonuclease family protein [Rhodoferax antarcticus]|uniref:Putative phage-type endonuclease n=1 Tax=Rhodoferax antarcticus ANT.BR TaxID=1111071 RepID=A0A1Q8Y9A0_9BURK|nr:YqaJ viral recombinase family protein [Rhodoferax antarcticus]OLP04578.1 putative phage-type endonuclease [Rhodoferax antarcticus ANT.BR]